MISLSLLLAELKTQMILKTRKIHKFRYHERKLRNTPNFWFKINSAKRPPTLLRNKLRKCKTLVIGHIVRASSCAELRYILRCRRVWHTEEHVSCLIVKIFKSANSVGVLWNALHFMPRYVSKHACLKWQTCKIWVCSRPPVTV